MEQHYWSRKDVPHRGWTCVAVEDLGRPGHTCIMCGNENVRYVHEMQHQKWAEPLLVGCVCAEHMEEGYTAKRNEARLRSRAARRLRWPGRWKTTYKLSWHIKVGGCAYVVTKYGRLCRCIGETWQNSKRSFATDLEAKLAVFDELYPPRVPI